ncbi:hypothetical protein Dimus_010500, partial [Dionaea muscipula]
MRSSTSGSCHTFASRLPSTSAMSCFTTKLTHNGSAKDVQTSYMKLSIHSCYFITMK